MQPLPIVAPVTLPIQGADQRFAVHRVYCVGRNYADHAKEMGASGREPPFFFFKPSDALFEVGQAASRDWPYPSLTQDLHYEVELVVAIGHGGKNIAADQAAHHIWGYAAGLDMTRRDLQRALGDQKKPWEIGKSFDRSAPLGTIHRVAQTGHFAQGAIWLKVNGEIKQSANLNQMIWSVAEQISKLSEAFELFPGDIIFSGTPENVGPVVRGDLIEMHIDGLPNLSVKVV